MLSSKSRFTLTPHRRTSRRFTYGLPQTVTSTAETSSTLDNATCFDTFQEPLADLAASFELMHSNFEQLKQVNDALVDFNDAFGAFLFGMTANGSSINWPQAPINASFDRLSNKQPSSQSPLFMVDAKATDNNITWKRPTTTRAEAKVGKEQKEDEPTRMARKFTRKIDIRKIIERLPLKFREQLEHTKNMETVLKTLRASPEGLNMQTIVNQSGLPKHRATECLNALVHSKDVIKVNKKGQLCLYKLDSVRFPSTLVQIKSDK
ncbi:hypothetical protein K450DRAFT_227583 [Umbelopsis ramanniana AG]|uniref:DASH complex subunit DAM1 n=1 Tax=Umbelopsis ramanniana AG TaxID=1314678 RepID=A0AAD5HHT3_UMBRA|nr:uncharacterized protein K450DRAFT_227583 [Umbelopsis ramanniana AG]KAI8582528.1 hypothetical protein K450DRAFT_227583 [Umbelopsis ramanniana AG]